MKGSVVLNREFHSIDLVQLEAEIVAKTGWVRKDVTNEIGFAGLNLKEIPDKHGKATPAQCLLEIVWTNDGTNGEIAELKQVDFLGVQTAGEQHVRADKAV